MTKTTTRHTHLRGNLMSRRRELQEAVQRRMRHERTDTRNDVGDELEESDANISADVGFALLQMKAQTLSRIDEALGRLDVGEYGCCFECRAEISESRLRALPFAVRCKACEESRERGLERTRRLTQQQTSFSLFPEAVSS